MASVSLKIPRYVVAGWQKVMEEGNKTEYRCSGLPQFKDQIKEKKNAIQLSITQEGSHCTCTSVALIALAIIAAGLGTTLIALSGGPNNLQIFVPGICTDVVALGLTIWFIAVVNRSLQFRRLEKEAYRNFAKDIIAEKDILEAMHHEHATPDHIKNAMHKFSPKQRTGFIEYVQKQYFPAENQQPEIADTQDEAKQKVLKTLAQFPAELGKLDLDHLNRQFALAMLQYIDPQLIEQDAHTPLLNALIKAAETQKDAETAKVFAQHPTAIAMMTNNQALNLDDSAAIYNHMQDGDKALFLKNMMDNHAALDNNNPNKKKLYEIIKSCISNTLTQAFMGKFDGGPASEETQALLQQLVRWPISIMQMVLERSLYRKGFIDAFEHAMAEKKEHTISFWVGRLNNMDNLQWAKNAIKKCLSYCVLQNQEVPKLMKDLFSQVPAPIAAAALELQAKAEEEALGTIISQMSGSDKATYLATLKRNKEAVFRQSMNAELKIAGSQNGIGADSTVVRYFQRHPEDFREYVIINKELQEDARFALGLDILENMGEAAEKTIPLLDAQRTGYANYNKFLNLLNQQLENRNLATHPLPGSRLLLMAKFQKAPQAGDTSVLGKNAIKVTDDPQWAKWRSKVTPEILARVNQVV